MRIGLWIDEHRPFPEVVADIEKAAAAGYDTAWIGERAGWDALTVFAAAGDRGIGLGTAVTTTYPRHPLALAAQALTTQAATGGRLTLGIGPSHGPAVEDRYGLTFDRPGTHTEEYLGILRPALAGAAADLDGRVLTGHGGVVAPGVSAPPVLLAAHGPRMLRLARDRADGVLTTWTTPRAVAEEIRPTVGDDVAVVAGVVFALTGDPDGTRAEIGAAFALANDLPTYRRWLDLQGLAGAADTVVAGDEQVLGDAVRAFADAGVTEISAIPAGVGAERERTLAFLATLRT
ncbi:TIGR03564 family F420-dependent LLM class oxidoreductase [Pseudonocardia sp. WMMC193]|uniref:TIGR03564 family F420-dependent LLM class oxidoreductase n=1 Tax=Pseudonocardia sp. WMMC193 TaxID=2911965 RepID=UPI001EFFFBF0|nr:TIGR03564 family F420-dependent LLM class oxidoreductase [Pseudonocardia sp. WMMC193]MCF7553437.1 TIGR03564 family F420-dependent LLM class oxidoreductase [Pseudonocardia sp. WMMC193]